jgi:hypothetical protein
VKLGEESEIEELGEESEVVKLGEESEIEELGEESEIVKLGEESRVIKEALKTIKSCNRIFKPLHSMISGGGRVIC